MKPKRAIVREPGAMYAGCISSHPMRHTIDLELARRQHSEYCAALADLGIEILRLPRDDTHPDSCFVEDNVVVFGKKALVCRMARESRRGEEQGVEAALAGFVKTKRTVSPGTIEGGDVIHFAGRLVSGLTQRTNESGVEQLRTWLGVKVDTIKDESIVHLKSYVNYLSEDVVISTKKFAKHQALDDLQVLIVPDDEWYGTNNIAVGDRVIMPKGFPTAESLIRKAGFNVTSLAMTEFPKCEGALTCLSILF